LSLPVVKSCILVKSFFYFLQPFDFMNDSRSINQQKEHTMMQDALITAIVFFGIYHIVKMFTDFLLKRKIIKAGHTEKAGILDPIAAANDENRYPTLKWGLVAMFAGAGLILIESLSRGGQIEWVKDYSSLLPVGIELVFISAGFLIYFFFVNMKKRG
jgi:hypothetical protein